MKALGRRVLEDLNEISRNSADGCMLINLPFARCMQQAEVRDFVGRALPRMNNLAETLGQSCHLAVESVGDRCRPPRRIASPDPFAPLPAHNAAVAGPRVPFVGGKREPHADRVAGDELGQGADRISRDVEAGARVKYPSDISHKCLMRDNANI